MPESIEELEALKIRFEIEELARPFWRKSGFVVPFLAALISIALGHFSGWFDIQAKLLEIKRHELKKEVDEFQKEKGALEESIERLKTENHELNKSNALLQAEKKVLGDQVVLAKKYRQAQSTFFSTEVLRFKELIRSDALPECEGYDRFFNAIQDRFYNVEDSDLEHELELIQFEVDNQEDMSGREGKLIEYMNKRGMLDDDGCFEDVNGEPHCTNF